MKTHGNIERYEKTKKYLKNPLNLGVLQQFFQKVSYKQLNDVYYSFHTQDPEWCVKNLLEMNGQSEEIFDNNLRLKTVISAKGEY